MFVESVTHRAVFPLASFRQSLQVREGRARHGHSECAGPGGDGQAPARRSAGRQGQLVLVDPFRNAVEESFESCAVEFPGQQVTVLHKERLHRFELCDGEAGITTVERLERVENIDW